MTRLLIGVVLLAASLAVFVYSMPRHGKTAKFVGGPWEGYIVVGLVVLFGLGLLVAITGVVDATKG